MKGYKIEHKALSLGQHNFSFVVGADLFELYDYSEIKESNCSVDIDMTYSETMMELYVKISGSVVVECDRCLDDCNIDIDFEAPLIVKISGEIDDNQESKESDGDILWLPLGESALDLSQYIYESIILALPYQRVHADGECNPEMIERFKIVSEEEFDEIEQKSQQSPNKTISGSELSKLEALKKQMESND
ncbi:MAG: DUF177 domain-containing protein [Rikenellaceae bacterium]